MARPNRLLPTMSKTTRLVISGVLAAISLVLYEFMGIGYTWYVIAMMLVGSVIAGWPIFTRAISALKYKIVGIDLLVTIASIGAIIIGEYWEAAAVTFLFMLGDWLETRTLEKTRSSIRSLLDMAPSVARVRRDGKEVEIDPDDVVEGDHVIIKPGEKIPVDGIVLEGNAFVNQAAITGESFPVRREEGEGVFSGTILESGYLVVNADKVGEDTTFARILEMVEEAQDKKARTQSFLERFSRYYTPAVIVLAIIVGLITQNVYLALTLLVVSCPGALVISAPVSIVAGIGNGAKNGVLIKGGDIMEKMGTVKAIAFDKTGTLTEGKARVTKINTFEVDGQKMTEDELLRLAAIGESYSEHPLGDAIIAEADSRWKWEGSPENSDIIAGHGLTFEYEGVKYGIGNRKLMDDIGVDHVAIDDYLNEEEAKGQTVVMLSSEKGIHGTISIADTVREEARELITTLKAQGINHIVMLTGDNKRAAKAIANELGLDGYYAELLPEDKVSALIELQDTYGRVAMIGDGVNDAPALATADLGVAIGGAGTDVAMETADVVLMSEDIGRLSYAIGLSRGTVSNMRQNIVFALAVAFVLIGGVLVQSVNMRFGMLVHEASVILVILNAMRLMYWGRSYRRNKQVMRDSQARSARA